MHTSVVEAGLSGSIRSTSQYLLKQYSAVGVNEEFKVAFK